MIATIKIGELLPYPLPGPMWAKAWVGFWLCMALYYAVLAFQQWRVKRKEKSQQSRHLRSSSKVAVDSDLNEPKGDKFGELWRS